MFSRCIGFRSLICLLCAVVGVAATNALWYVEEGALPRSAFENPNLSFDIESKYGVSIAFSERAGFGVLVVGAPRETSCAAVHKYEETTDKVTLIREGGEPMECIEHHGAVFVYVIKNNTIPELVYILKPIYVAPDVPGSLGNDIDVFIDDDVFRVAATNSDVIEIATFGLKDYKRGPLNTTFEYLTEYFASATTSALTKIGLTNNGGVALLFSSVYDHFIVKDFNDMQHYTSKELTYLATSNDPASNLVAVGGPRDIFVYDLLNFEAPRAFDQFSGISSIHLDFADSLYVVHGNALSVIKLETNEIELFPLPASSTMKKLFHVYRRRLIFDDAVYVRTKPNPDEVSSSLVLEWTWTSPLGMKERVVGNHYVMFRANLLSICFASMSNDGCGQVFVYKRAETTSASSDVSSVVPTLISGGDFNGLRIVVAALVTIILLIFMCVAILFLIRTMRRRELILHGANPTRADSRRTSLRASHCHSRRQSKRHSKRQSLSQMDKSEYGVVGLFSPINHQYESVDDKLGGTMPTFRNIDEAMRIEEEQRRKEQEELQRQVNIAPPTLS